MSEDWFKAFSNAELRDQALRHRSAGQPHNERLEFLGDAILGFLIADALYQKFPKAREGDLTHARSQLVRESTLAEIAREQKLGALLQLGAGEMKSGGHRRDSILADAVEAVIAAVYLDAGMHSAQSLVNAWFGERLQLLSLKAQAKDPKTRLQEWLQSKQHALPVYRLLQATGSEHAKQFEVSCELEQLAVFTQGVGNSVKAAEADAALQALSLLGQAK